jgi:REP element-mobilizing transposase RayT
MADTFSQIHIQIVFAVKHRVSLIDPSWEISLHKYITGIITNKGQKLLAINGMPDHVHIFIGMKPSCCLSDLVREIKKASTDFIHENKLSKYRFNWQEGFGAFSYSRSDIDRVVKYILNQKEHHAKQKFRSEYKILLQEYEVAYEEKYLFSWIDDD